MTILAAFFFYRAKAIKDCQHYARYQTNFKQTYSRCDMDFKIVANLTTISGSSGWLDHLVRRWECELVLLREWIRCLGRKSDASMDQRGSGFSGVTLLDRKHYQKLDWKFISYIKKIVLYVTVIETINIWNIKKYAIRWSYVQKVYKTKSISEIVLKYLKKTELLV